MVDSIHPNMFFLSILQKRAASCDQVPIRILLFQIQFYFYHMFLCLLILLFFHPAQQLYELFQIILVI